MLSGVATIAVFAATIGLASVSQAASLEFEAVPESGRIEVPEAGFAISLPTDWTYARPTLSQLEELAARLPNAEAGLIGLLEEAVAEGEPPWLTARGPDFQVCDVNLTKAYGLTHDEFIAQATAELAELDLDLVVDSEVSRLQLPVGEVSRQHMQVQVLGMDLQVSTYLMGSDLLLYTLACSGLSRPADDWLSIATTFELLPDGATSVPGSGQLFAAGRIERPVDGFAITFPDDMWVGAVTPEQHDALWGDDPYGEQIETILSAEGIDQTSGCQLQNISTWAALPPPVSAVEEAMAFDVSGLRGSEDWLSVDDGEMLELRPGRVGRFTAVDSDGWTWARYYYRDKDDWYKLECFGSDPPDDRWLSVADTLEFLSDGEG